MQTGLLGNLERGLVFIVSAPAGTGKTTLVKKLLDEEPSVTRSVSYTTRKARQNEIDGEDYHFVTQEIFKKKIEENDFLEHVFLFDNCYGTCVRAIEEQQEQGKHVVLVIDTQGAIIIQKKINAISIFISPPSFEELQRRLEERNTESEKDLQQRLEWAQKELMLIENYDYHVVNEKLESAYQMLKSIFVAEELKSNRMKKSVIKNY